MRIPLIPNPAWKDYKHGSWLVCAFGFIDAKVDILGRDETGTPNHFGIIIHPYDVIELTGTLDQAKLAAEVRLVNLLRIALVVLGGTHGLPMASPDTQHS
jgi:hypothetical protein